MKFIIIGYGGRGAIYTENLLMDKRNSIVAVCDKDSAKLKICSEKYNLKEAMLFEDEDKFFASEIQADICIVSTQDHQHKGHAIKALTAGYDILLEKPIANSIEDCEEIYNCSMRLNRKIFVCHVLRYAPFFANIKKEIESGKYGNIMTINLTENVAYWHQAHSYIRGNWRKTPEASPMIIAKSCHDLDIIAWLMDGVSCDSVTSYGSLSYFNSRSAPEGSTERCLDCKYSKTCPYSAEKIYIIDRAMKESADKWPSNIVHPEPTVENLYEALKTSPYGKCVFRCDNNVVDHQVVNMHFENDATAHLTMTAFSAECYREIHVHLDHGDIYGDMKNNKLYCNVFGEDEKIIDITFYEESGYGHGGGDYLLCMGLSNHYNDNLGDDRIDIAQSMRSHFIGFCAEESRLKNGMTLKPKH